MKRTSTQYLYIEVWREINIYKFNLYVSIIKILNNYN